MKAVVAGTFGPLHIGHHRLLSTAVEIADELVVALTTDEFASWHRTRDVPVYNDRLRGIKEIVDELNTKDIGVSFTRLDDPYGISIEDAELDAIVVSEETEERVKEINRIRRGNDMDPLVKIVVPLVLDENGERISSTRIVNGEIDGECKSL